MKKKRKSIHKTEMRVQWFDVDRENIVYFGNYFRFFSTAEDEFLRSHGITHNALKNELGIAFTMISAECCYKQPTLYEDLIEVETRARLENNIFLTFIFRVFRKDGQVFLAEGKVRTACVQLENGFKLARIPDEVFKRLKQIADEDD